MNCRGKNSGSPVAPSAELCKVLTSSVSQVLQSLSNWGSHSHQQCRGELQNKIRKCDSDAVSLSAQERDNL